MISPLSKITDEKEELKLCPIRALSIYLKKTKGPNRAKTLFVSPKDITKPLSKRAISKLIKTVASLAYDMPDEERRIAGARAIRGMAPSLLMRHNITALKVFAAGTWKGDNTFTTFYLRDFTHENLEVASLGSLVLAGSCVNVSRIRESDVVSIP